MHYLSRGVFSQAHAATCLPAYPPYSWYGLNVWLPTLLDSASPSSSNGPRGPPLDVFQDAFVVAAANLPGNIAAALLLDRAGRKPVLVGSLLLACAATVAFAFARSEGAAVAAACLMNAISVGSWNALDALSVEMFPTQLRTSSMGILAAAGRTGSILGQLGKCVVIIQHCLHARLLPNYAGCRRSPPACAVFGALVAEC